MTRKKLPKTVAGRRKFQAKFPRTIDRLHGLTQVEDLFESTTVEGWKPALPLDGADGS